MDIKLQEQVTELYALARDRSEPALILLAGKLADVFFSESVNLSKREEQLVNELIDDILKNEHKAVRNALVDRFAEKIDAPRPVALKIAKAPIDVAAGVLKNNENLNDDDLIMVVETKTIAHAQNIAYRRNISEAVADALIETGDLKIMQIVAENLGARLSHKAIDVMVEAARLSAILQKPLFERPELGKESAARLYWWAAHDLRRSTLEKYGFGPGKLDAELNTAIDDMLRSHMLQKDEDEAMEDLADWLAERNALEIKYLLQFLRAGHYKLFNIALSRLSRLDLKVVNAITSEKGGRLLSALCRAIDIDKGRFISIFLMSRGGRTDEHIVNPRELTEALTVFDRLSPNLAQSMLQTWRVNPSSVLEQIGTGNEEAAEQSYG